MSLLASVNSGSATQDYGVLNLGSSASPVVSTGGNGILRLQDDGGGNTAIRSAKSNGLLALGANDTTPANIVLTTAAATITSPLACTNSATFTGAVDMTVTAPTLRTRSVAGGAIPNALQTALPQPAGLSAGLYSIVLSCPGNEDYQASALGYWNGTSWSAGAAGTATKITGVGLVCVIEPVPAGGATLQIYQNSGGALNVSYIYYTQLSAQFP